MNIDTKIVKVNIDNNIKYGLIINNNYYNNYYKKIKNKKDIPEDIIKKYKKYSLLSKEKVITSIDNININENGYLSINNIEIPFKSYIWLLANENINIELYKIKKSRFENNNIINLNKTTINIVDYKLEKNNIGINLSEIKYIEYNNKYIFELNERFFEIFEKLIKDNDNNNIINYINNNKYNIKNKKILIGIDLLNVTRLKIVHKIKNIDDINGQITKKELKKYIKYLLK
jgi:hypothetical protein